MDTELVANTPRGWLAVIVISALFALPMLLELVLHGDANVAKYFAYGSSSSAGGHSAAQVTGFVLWFWWPGASPWVVPLLLTAAAAGLRAGPVVEHPGPVIEHPGPDGRLARLARW